MKLFFGSLLISLAISTGFLTPAMDSLSSFANPTNGVSTRKKRVVYRPKLESRGTPTGLRVGAAGRGNGECPTVTLPLTALVPSTEEPDESSQIFTVAERPVFWVYIPYATNPTAPEEVTLTLRTKVNGKESQEYQERFKLRKTPGIVAFPLPKTLPNLESGQQYYWQLSYICQVAMKSPERIRVYGSIQRVPLDPNLKQHLDTASAQDRIVIYAENGLWQDALTQLAILYRREPENLQLKADWVDLLGSVKLEHLASFPVSIDN
jgi:Domain of Unknown Function (DUF928)